MAFGNGTTTVYDYDPLTFRLTHLTSTRPASFAANAQIVQELAYFYDPVGNITRIRDDADTQNVVYFNNQRVEPSADYTYDPLYRLIARHGREHLGQTGGALNAAAAGHQRRFLAHDACPSPATAMRWASIPRATPTTRSAIC